MKLKTILAGTMPLCHLFVYGQNLVPNSSMETYSLCPNSSNYSANLATGWQVLTGHGGTPDYFNSCASGLYDWTNFGNDALLVPHSGNGYIGMLTRTNFDQREYAEIQLTSPLTAGLNYTVSAWVYAGRSDYNADVYTNNIGIYISSTNPSVSGCGMCVNVYNVTPQVVSNTIITGGSWVQISGTYTAAGGEQWLVLGNFSSNAATSISSNGATPMSPPPNTAYTFFDDVMVQESSPLPVELLSFEADCEENLMRLTWSTSSEQNNSHFNIEKSTDAIIYTTIGTVPGSGNSNVIQHYDFEDHVSYNTNTYYRIKQVDLNGNFTYLPTISVNCMSQNDFQVYPSPFSDQLTVYVNLVNTDLLIEVQDMLGKQVHSQVLVANSGNLNIQTQTWASGCYIVNISKCGGERLFTKKIIKTRL
jgi:hypothetical protein